MYKNCKILFTYCIVVVFIFLLTVPAVHSEDVQKQGEEKAVLTEQEVKEKHKEEPRLNDSYDCKAKNKEEKASFNKAELEIKAIVWPAKGEVIKGVGFSYSKTFCDYRYHDGIDIKVSPGTEVVAVLPGKVILEKETKTEGQKITIEHDPQWCSTYYQLGKTLVNSGEMVEKGQVIGRVGELGSAEPGSESHLHFSLYKNKKAVNPCEYLP